MDKNVFDKALEREDVYDPKTTLSAELGDLIKGLTDESKLKLADTIIKKEYGQTKMKNILGFTLVLTGIVMIFLGVNDIINLEIASEYISAKLINASPGTFISLLGFFIIILSKSKLKK